MTEHLLADGAGEPLQVAKELPNESWSPLLGRESAELKDMHIVYHPDYNVRFFGLEKKHPFDSSKYEHLANYVQRNHSELTIYRPESPISDEVLLTVHSPEYIHSLRLTGCRNLLNKEKIRRSRDLIARISEMNDFNDMKTVVMLLMIYTKLLRPMRLATQGTIDAILLALENGWAINLGGGFHHASSTMGSGYCFYADVPIAIQLLHQVRPQSKILIVDLDVHHGDGNESICGQDPNVKILDMFNSNIFAANSKPDDEKRVDYMAAIEPGVLDGEWLNALGGKKINGIEDEEYLSQLETLYLRALEEWQPDFIFYNAGTDLYMEDPLGRMNISKQGIIRRDALIFQQALERKIPICMVPSGGYAKKGFPQIADSYHSHIIETSSAEIICESLSNIFEMTRRFKARQHTSTGSLKSQQNPTKAYRRTNQGITT